MSFQNLCKNCDEVESDHVAQRCLFDTTSFEIDPCFACCTPITNGLLSSLFHPPLINDLMNSRTVCECWDSLQLPLVDSIINWLVFIKTLATNNSDMEMIQFIDSILKLPLKGDEMLSDYSSLEELRKAYALPNHL